MQPAFSKELAALLDWLNDQRSHVLGVNTTNGSR